MLLCVVVNTTAVNNIIVIRSRRMLLTIFRRRTTFYIKFHYVLLPPCLIDFPLELQGQSYDHSTTTADNDIYGDCHP